MSPKHFYRRNQPRVRPAHSTEAPRRGTVEWYADIEAARERRLEPGDSASWQWWLSSGRGSSSALDGTEEPG